MAYRDSNSRPVGLCGWGALGAPTTILVRNLAPPLQPGAALSCGSKASSIFGRHFPAQHPQSPSQKVRARVAHDGALCSKNKFYHIIRTAQLLEMARGLRYLRPRLWLLILVEFYEIMIFSINLRTSVLSLVQSLIGSGTQYIYCDSSVAGRAHNLLLKIYGEKIWILCSSGKNIKFISSS